MTVRPTVFDKAPTSGGTAEISAVSPEAVPGASTWVSEEVAKNDRPELASAKAIVSGGGRGVGYAENFAMLDTRNAQALGQNCRDIVRPLYYYLFAQFEASGRRTPVRTVKMTGGEAAPRARATYKPARRHLIARARSDERVQQLLSSAF